MEAGSRCETIAPDHAAHNHYGADDKGYKKAALSPQADYHLSKLHRLQVLLSPSASLTLPSLSDNETIYCSTLLLPIASYKTYRYDKQNAEVIMHRQLRRLLSSSARADFDGETAALYESLAENHSHLNGPYALIVRRLRNQRMDSSKKITIVDLCSGQGEPASTIARALKHATVISTDVSVDMHKKAAIRAIDIRNLKAMVADVQDLSAFKSNSIDAVTCCYGFMFPEDKVKALSEAHRILKPGGSLISTHWMHLGMAPLGKQVVEALCRAQSPPIEPQPQKINPMALAKSGLFKSLAVEAGFKESNIWQTTSTYPFNLGADKEKQYKMFRIPIADVVDRLRGEDLARRLFEQNIGKFSVIDSATGHLIVPDNRFQMFTLKKEAFDG